MNFNDRVFKRNEQVEATIIEKTVEMFLFNTKSYELFRSYEFNEKGQFECVVHCQSHFPYKKRILHILIDE
jgi:hypothetical protein